MDDKVVGIGANPLRDKVLAAMDKLPSSEQKKEISRWRNGFQSVAILFLFAFSVWAANEVGHQQAAKQAASTHSQVVNQLESEYNNQIESQSKLHQAQLEKATVIQANEVKAVRLQHQKDLASKTTVYEADLTRIKTESQTRVTKARQHVSAVEAKAAAQKAETDKVIRGLIHKNEKFKVYYETPTHQRAADIIWPERVHHPDKTGNTNASDKG